MNIVADKNDLEFGKDVKQLTVGKSADLRDYMQANENKTYYAVLFCAENWNEQVEFETFSNENLYNFTMTEAEKKKTVTLDFYMPCKFEKHPDKQMIFYSVFYNISFIPNTFFLPPDIPEVKDLNLLTLKVSIDNAVLEQKAKQKGMSKIP